LPKNKEFSLNILPRLDEERFRQFLRVSPQGFNYIISKIQDYLVFKSNGNFKQMEPSFQLAIALHRFGNETSSESTCINTGQIFGIGEGTAVLYTQRVIIALMDLWEDQVRWPSEEEQLEMR
ncbi:hypothetical protein L211DRAFT_767069, partial [Terfezia boudieri ATCC MYA-4762]